VSTRYGAGANETGLAWPSRSQPLFLTTVADACRPPFTVFAVSPAVPFALAAQPSACSHGYQLNDYAAALAWVREAARHPAVFLPG
jgi:hypothetical protein